jgi:hypothetical protein
VRARLADQDQERKQSSSQPEKSMIKMKKAGGTVLTIKTAISASPMWSSLNLRCPAVISATIRFEQARQGG